MAWDEKDDKSNYNSSWAEHEHLYLYIFIQYL